MKVFLIAGEETGDRLGGDLMRALSARLDGKVEFAGVGGRDMAEQGLVSLFPLEELSIVGIAAIVKRLPAILRRIRQTADAAVAARPDVVVIIDSPEFTHRVARRLRRIAPDIPIVDYVSPSVWAWRPGRAKAMRAYVDHVLALLPFEPDTHRRLGGPPCSFVGHPLAAEVDLMRPGPQEQRRRDAAPPLLLVLPGSRSGEISHHLDLFGQTIAELAARGRALDLVLPTPPRLAARVRAATASWPVRPRIVTDPAEKWAAFRTARAALAASGTVTLELALAKIPTVVAYRLSGFEFALARWLVKVPTVVLANLVLNDNAMPEFLQHDARPERLANALAPLLADSPERKAQLSAFDRLDAIMAIGEADPSAKAAEIVIAQARRCG